MKTLRYFAFAASILAVACAKENNEPVLAEAQEMTFSASAEDGYTKTGLEEIENGAKVLWLDTDKISVFDGANANCEFATTEGGETAEFSGKAVAVAEGSNWYAVYPYNAANSISGTTISTILPAVQKVASNAIADGVNVTAAKSATNSFQFKNLCGLIRIAVPAEFSALKSVTINSDKAIAGEFTVDCSGEAPAFASAGADAVKSVTLQKADDSAMTAGNWYVAAFPGTHNISIVLTDNSGKKVILGGNVNVSVKASKIAGVGEVDTDVFTHTTHLVKSSDDLQAAINAAAAGDRLLLAAGTYKGNFTLKDGVNISGGWNADYTVCDPETYKTVLDGNKAGIVLTQSADFENVTTISELCITNGSTTGDGAGIYSRKNCNIKNCEIYGNAAKNGAGIYQNGTGEIINCHIHDNISSNSAGGAYVKGTISNCLLENNEATSNAGGGCQLQHGKMFNCILKNNIGKNASGLRCYGNTTAANSLIVNNTCTSAGGAVVLNGENSHGHVIANLTIANNHNEANGTNACGVYTNMNGRIVGCIIYGNTIVGVETGSAPQLAINHKYPRLWNNAIQTGGVNLLNSEYDTPRNVSPTYIDFGSALFTNAAQGDFTLVSTATCIDKGETNDTDSNYADKFGDAKKVIDLLKTDLAGNTRVCGTEIDCGCYEYQK